jgi:hypothetical protein
LGTEVDRRPGLGGVDLEELELRRAVLLGTVYQREVGAPLRRLDTDTRAGRKLGIELRADPWLGEVDEIELGHIGAVLACYVGDRG